MTLTSLSLRLPGGLQLHLIHQPDASKAAALVRIAAGSHHEPDRWPGLAHLLEHLLFTGSAAFPDQQRLMPWIQGAGGRVNATTLQQCTAYFFEVAAPQLEAGLARLMDMLVAPLFTPAAVVQEVAVIDAEYQLLQRHTPALSEAALLASVAQPTTFQRFHVGNRSHFGDDTEALRRALRAFHQRYYQRANMQLWLQGPVSLDQLEQMARSACAALPAGDPACLPALPQLKATRDMLLRVEGLPCFWLSYLLPAATASSGDAVTLLREFITDDAPGSLLATLRARGLCDSLNLQWLYLSATARWLALQFVGDNLTPDRAQDAEAIWYAWLQTLHQSTSLQRSHYGRLAAARFLRLAPLDQLRERALGFAPATTGDLSALITALGSAPVTRLCCGPDVQGASGQAQGFHLQRQPWQARPPEPSGECIFYFYPLQEAFAEPALPATAGPLLHCHEKACAVSLLLRPAFFQNFSLAAGKALAARLRPYFATLRHLGGEGEFSAPEGVWQLRLHLPDAHRLWAVHSALKELATPLPYSAPADEEGIAIRALLARLPEHLAVTTVPSAWCAVLSGGDRGLHQALSRLLSPFTAAASQPPFVVPARALQRLVHKSNEQALLLFLPLPQQDEATLAAARALALLYEPHFFQRLRAEQQIGYVVSCRYLRSADRDGILFLLQSPIRPPAALLRGCKNFLRDFSREMERLNADTISQLQARLRLLMTQQDAMEIAHGALRQQAGLPQLTEAAVQSLTPADLQTLHQQLLRARRRWTLLFCGGSIAPGAPDISDHL